MDKVVDKDTTSNWYSYDMIMGKYAPIVTFGDFEMMLKKVESRHPNKFVLEAKVKGLGHALT